MALRSAVLISEIFSRAQIFIWVGELGEPFSTLMIALFTTAASNTFGSIVISSRIRVERSKNRRNFVKYF
jgi:hypothetical protein